MKITTINYSFVCLFLGLLVNGMGQSVLFSILAPLSRTIGIIDSGIGIIISCSASMLVIFTLIWGRVIDRFNIKYVFIFGLTSFGIGSILFAYVLELGQGNVILPTTTLLLLVVVRMIYAAMTAGTHPSAMAYVSKLTDDRERVSAIALISSSYNLGLIVGPLLVFINYGDDILAPMYFTSYLSILLAMASVFILKGYSAVEIEKAKDYDSSLISLWNSRTLTVLFALMLVNAIFSCLQQNAGFLVQDLLAVTNEKAVKMTGIILSTIALAMLFTQVFLIQKFKISYKLMIALGYAFTGIGLIITVFFIVNINFLAIVISTAITGIGVGYLIPSLQTYLTIFASSDEQGRVAGYIFSFSALGFIIGPLLGTGLTGLGTWMPYLVSIVMLILSAVCVLIMSKHEIKEALSLG